MLSPGTASCLSHSSGVVMMLWNTLPSPIKPNEARSLAHLQQSVGGLYVQIMILFFSLNVATKLYKT